MKILSIFGTRPEAIKMAPVVRLLEDKLGANAKVCVTGQHRAMLDQFLHLFDIHPAYDLNLMQSSQDLTNITCQVLTGVQKVLRDFKPDRVLVQGDTTTTMAASLAAFYEKIPVGHIEAGLRSGNLHSPWPEEADRIITTHITDLHFAPTMLAAKNLQAEGIDKEKIVITGNTVIDALLYAQAQLYTHTPLLQQIKNKFSFLDDKKKFILVTGHRRESFGNGMLQICQALIKISEQANIDIVYPVHLNPNVQKPVQQLLNGYKNIHLIEPQDYLPFLYLMDHCYLILTDSGGIQEEAASFKKPVLVMRHVTERSEAIFAGSAKLVGTSTSKIVSETIRLIENQEAYQLMRLAPNCYGDGHAAERIVDTLLNYPSTTHAAHMASAQPLHHKQ